jgi:hypothetical protein
MRVAAVILAACLLAAGAAYAATSLLENADGTGEDQVGNLSPVGSIGSEQTSTKDRTTRTHDDDERITTEEATSAEDSTTEETTTEDHDGGSDNSGSGSGNSGHGGDDDD